VTAENKFTDADCDINNTNPDGTFTRDLNFANGDNPKTLDPHPDGLAWDDCCTSDPKGHNVECFCRKINGKSRFDMYGGKNQKAFQNGGRFFCVHRRTPDGFHRECGGWASLIGHEKIKPPTTEKSNEDNS